MSQCKLRHSRANARLYKWAKHGDLFILQIIPGRAPSMWAKPRRPGLSLPPLGGPGPHDILVGRARSEAFTLHQTGLATLPSPVKCYSVNGVYESLLYLIYHKPIIIILIIITGHSSCILTLPRALYCRNIHQSCMWECGLREAFQTAVQGFSIQSGYAAGSTFP